MQADSFGTGPQVCGLVRKKNEEKTHIIGESNSTSTLHLGGVYTP